MIAMTTSNSISVKPDRLRRGIKSMLFPSSGYSGGGTSSLRLYDQSSCQTAVSLASAEVAPTALQQRYMYG